jgi:RNA polymerase sigma-70 factor (sigma-E family)
VDAGTVTRRVGTFVGERPEARDDDAFADLFASQRDAVLRLAYVLTGDGGIAEDVVADAFAAMYPRWRSGRVEEPEAYLRRAVVNQVRGRFRREATRRRYDARARTDVHAVSEAGALAERDAVREALLALPVGQRAVVALRFLEDRSEAETAVLLGVSTGTVKSQCARGLERLRTTLAQYERGGA